MPENISFSSPVVKTVLKVCSLFADKDAIASGEEDNVNAQWRILSYRDHFSYLWGIGEKRDCSFNTQGVNQGLTLLVVCDGVPDTKNKKIVNCSRYITPLDWAVSNSLFWAEQAHDENIPKLRIFILDGLAQTMEGAFSESYFNQFQKRDTMAMPWVRVVRPFDLNEEAWGFTNFLINLMETGRSPNKQYVPFMNEVFNEKKGGYLEIVKRIWAANISKPSNSDDHHSISNILGPLILQGDEASDLHVQALRELMLRIDLIPKKEDNPPLLTLQKPWIDVNDEEWREKIGRLQELGCPQVNVGIVDDYVFDQGWDEVICKALGAVNSRDASSSVGTTPVVINSSGLFHLEASDTADWLLELIDGSDQRFSLSVNTSNNTRYSRGADILFLDLRLFSGVDVSVEKEFITKVLEKARLFQIKNANPFQKINGLSELLPWPGFNFAELDAVATWCKEEKGRSAAIYPTALTFLPRLIALTDCSLPIILFSSTGKREIVAKLKDYENILTDFEKPRISGAADEDVVNETAFKFRQAFSKAIDLCYARAAVNRVKSLKPVEIGSNLTKANHFEIYIDESRNPEQKEFVVGGLLVGYEDEKDAVDVNKIMEDKGLKWYGIGDTIKKKRPNDQQLQDNILKPLEEIIKKRPVVPLSLFRFPIPESPADITDLMGRETLDNMFLTLLKTIIEILLFEITPILAKDPKKISASIFVATRMRVPKSPLGENGWENLYKKYGIKTSVTGTPSVGDIQIYPPSINLITEEGKFNSAQWSLITSIWDRVLPSQKARKDPPKLGFSSLAPDFVYTIAAEILSSRQSKIKIDIKNALGAQLIYWKKIPHPCLRHMHYIADLLANRAELDKQKDQISNDVFSEWACAKSTGLSIVDFRDDDLLKIIDASRRLEVNDIVGALVQAIQPSIRKMAIVTVRIICQRIKDSLINLQGEEFIRFSSLLKEGYGSDDVLKLLPPKKSVKSSKPRPSVVATITKIDTKTYYITASASIDGLKKDIVIPPNIKKSPKKKTDHFNVADKIEIEYKISKTGILWATKIIVD